MMTIDKLAVTLLTVFRQSGPELADAVRDEAVRRYGQSFVRTALRQARQYSEAEHRGIARRGQ